MGKTTTVTRDKSANLKKLRILENKGLIKIHEVTLENFVNKAKNRVKPIGVWNHSKWDECVWADEKNTYDAIRKIIGKHNIKDAMHLEAHIRNGFDFFVTNDLDEFIKNGKRESLENQFLELKIVTVQELEKLL